MQEASATREVDEELDEVEELAIELELTTDVEVDKTEDEEVEAALVLVDEALVLEELALTDELVLTDEVVLAVEVALTVELALTEVVFLVVEATRFTIFPMPSSPQRYWCSATAAEAKANKPATCWNFMVM